MKWSDLTNVIPATNYTARLQKLSVYGGSLVTSSTNTTEYIETLKLTDLTSDQASFVDSRVPGQSVAQIHVSPALMIRQQWVFQSNTTSLYTINVIDGASAGAVYVYFTVELRITS